MPRNALWILPALLSLLSLGSAFGQVTPAHEWADAPADFLNSRWDPAKLGEAEEKWEQMVKDRKSTALMVIDSGYVVLSLGDITKPNNCYSVRKSFLNALYGRLHAEGKLQLETTVGQLGITDLVPLTAEEKSAEIHHLLKCRSGVYLPAEYETSSMIKNKPARGSHLPDTYHYYNNWDFNVSGTIYEQLSGKKIFDAFAQEIAQPIQMQDFDPRRHGRYVHANPPKSAHPAYAFKMSVRDYARFGLLYLRDGAWNGEQVISKEWIDQSTAPYSKHPVDPELGSGTAYGMLWWVSDTGWLYGQELQGVPYSARGNYGQYIAVIPAEDLVIAHANTSSLQPGAARNELFQFIIAAKKDLKKRS